MLDRLDVRIIRALKELSPALSRVALFVVFFWFGALKVFTVSPANPLVERLLHTTLPFLDFNQFIVFFGILEMFIGVSFLIPGWERLAIGLLVPHMITTALPLFLLPELAWSGFLVPTLEGQYIIKNLVIVALAFGIGGHLTPWDRKKHA